MRSDRFAAAVEAFDEVELFGLTIDFAGGFPMPMLVFLLRISAEPCEQIAGLGEVRIYDPAAHGAAAVVAARIAR